MAPGALEWAIGPVVSRQSCKFGLPPGQRHVWQNTQVGDGCLTLIIVLIVPYQCFKLVSLRGLDIILNTLGSMRALSAIVAYNPLECCCMYTLTLLEHWRHELPVAEQILNLKIFLQTLRELYILLTPGKTPVEYSAPREKRKKKLIHSNYCFIPQKGRK